MFIPEQRLLHHHLGGCSVVARQSSARCCLSSRPRCSVVVCAAFASRHFRWSRRCVSRFVSTRTHCFTDTVVCIAAGVSQRATTAWQQWHSLIDSLLSIWLPEVGPSIVCSADDSERALSDLLGRCQDAGRSVAGVLRDHLHGVLQSAVDPRSCGRDGVCQVVTCRCRVRFSLLTCN